jgi:hypothetical protein
MIGPTDLLHPSPASYFRNFNAFLIYFPKCPAFSTMQSYAPDFSECAAENVTAVLICYMQLGVPTVPSWQNKKL